MKNTSSENHQCYFAQVHVVGKATPTSRESRQLILDIDYCCPTLTAGQGGGVIPKILIWKQKQKS